MAGQPIIGATTISWYWKNSKRTRPMTSPQSNESVLKTGYWPHIDGLRAIAVLAVLLFHFKAAGFDAGYLGVDIFFVLSGFLVTRLIVKDISEHGKMRFGRFFARRVRRLFPTLAAVCVATTIASYIWLDADKLAAYGKSVAAAIFSLSNILFWSESGYFDAGSETKPLLHTWSLSVEEQFYLFWPAALALGYKVFKSSALKVLSISAFILSLLLIVIWTAGTFDAKKDSTIFFWMPFRIFEFMLGAFCILLYPKLASIRRSSSLHITGLGIALMLATIVIPSFNGYANGPILGGLACLGAALVILTPANAISEGVLSFSPVRWIGKISYSLYLVHWPLWIFAPEWLKTGGINWIWLTLASIALTIPLHYWIENPLRHGKLSEILRIKPAQDLIVYGLSAVLIAGSGMFIATQDNLPFRQAAKISAKDHENGMKRRFSKMTCRMAILDKDKSCDWDKPIQILFFGNSHENDGFNSFYQVFGENPDINFINFGSTNGCANKVQNGKIVSEISARNCKKRAEQLHKMLDDQIITHVVFTANIPYAANKQTLWSSLDVIKNANPETKFIVMGGFLNTKENCTTLINRYGGYDACLKPEYKRAFPLNERDNTKLKIGISYLYIDRIELMCKDRKLENCIASHNGEPMFYDQHHLSLEYSNLVGEEMYKKYANELKAQGLVK